MGSIFSSDAVKVIETPLIKIVTNEWVNATFTRNSIASFSIGGEMTLTVLTSEGAFFSIQVKSSLEGLKLVANPAINKDIFDKNFVLQLKDVKGFPSDYPLTILKWHYNGISNYKLVPIEISCWPSDFDSGMSVNIDYSMNIDQELRDVKICVPGCYSLPTIFDVDDSWTCSILGGVLTWTLDRMNRRNGNGSIQFFVAHRNSESLYPIRVQFSSHKLLSDVEVLNVKSTTSKKPIKYEITNNLSSNEYSFD